jgi:hypothetical protein
MWIGGGFLPVHAVMAISSEDRKYFEEMGELYVRRAMQMTDRFPFPFENSALEWLAERDEAQRPMREARQAKVAEKCISLHLCDSYFLAYNPGLKHRHLSRQRKAESMVRE